MRTFTSEMKVAEKLLEIRVCLLLVVVFICSIDRSTSNGSSTEAATTAISFRHSGNLTDEQLRSVVTIEFNFKNIDRRNRTAVNAAYREVRRKILAFLNSRKSTTAPPPAYTTTTAPYTTTAVATTTTTTTTATSTTSNITIPTTPITTTPTTPTTTAAAPTMTTTTPAVETTTKTPTTIAATTMATEVTTTLSTSTTTIGVPINRRRRNSGGNSIAYTEDDILFVEYDPVINENGRLRTSLFLDKKRSGDLLRDIGEFKAVGGAPVVNIYRGLPMQVTPHSDETPHLDLYFVIPILMAISVLLVIFIFVCGWKARNKKMIEKTTGMCWSV